MNSNTRPVRVLVVGLNDSVDLTNAYNWHHSDYEKSFDRVQRLNTAQEVKDQIRLSNESGFDVWLVVESVYDQAIDQICKDSAVAEVPCFVFPDDRLKIEKLIEMPSYEELAEWEFAIGATQTKPKKVNWPEDFAVMNSIRDGFDYWVQNMSQEMKETYLVLARGQNKLGGMRKSDTAIGLGGKLVNQVSALITYSHNQWKCALDVFSGATSMKIEAASDKTEWWINPQPLGNYFTLKVKPKIRTRSEALIEISLSDALTSDDKKEYAIRLLKKYQKEVQNREHKVFTIIYSRNGQELMVATFDQGRMSITEGSFRGRAELFEPDEKLMMEDAKGELKIVWDLPFDIE